MIFLIRDEGEINLSSWWYSVKMTGSQKESILRRLDFDSMI